MSRRRPDRRLPTVLCLVVAFLAAATLTGGLVTAPSAFAGSRARLAAPRKVVSATRKQALPLPAPGAVVVQSVALTKGTWTVIAKASAFGTATGDFFRCELFEHATALDGATTFLKPDVPEDVITNIAVIKVTTAVKVRQECGHDGTGGNGGSIDAGARIVAFLTPPSRVRVARSTAAANLGPNPVGVENLSLTPGTWVVAMKFTPVELTEPLGDANCAFDGNPVSREVGTEASDHAASTMFVVRNTVNLTSTTTFTLTCDGTGGVYIDPGAVFWAWKANALDAAGPSDCPIVNSASTVDAYVMKPIDCQIGSGSFPTELAGAHLPVGTWVGLGSVDALYSESVNVARCQMLDATHGRQLDETSTAETNTFGAPIVGDTNLAVVTVKKALDVEARCGQDTAATDATAKTSGWAFIRP